MARELSRRQLIERSIIKKYRKELWNPFIAAVKRYQLIQAGDRIGVCISGGKDSMILAKLMQQLQRVSDVPFEAVYLVMDPGYHPRNRAKIEENAVLLGLPIQIFETNIFAVTEQEPKSYCYLCARMRRGHLYSIAQGLGCNKIALGHHFDDVIETTLMGMLYGGQIQGDDAQAPQYQLSRHGADPAPVLRPGAGHHRLAAVQWAGVYPVRLPDDGKNCGEPGRHRPLQAPGGEAAHPSAQRGQRPGAPEHLPEHPRGESGHHGGF